MASYRTIAGYVSPGEDGDCIHYRITKFDVQNFGTNTSLVKRVLSNQHQQFGLFFSLSQWNALRADDDGIIHVRPASEGTDGARVRTH